MSLNHTIGQEHIIYTSRYERLAKIVKIAFFATSLGILSALFYSLFTSGLVFIEATKGNSSLPSFSQNASIAQSPFNTGKVLAAATTSAETEKEAASINPEWVPNHLIISKIKLETAVQTVEGTPGSWPTPDILPATPSLKSRVGKDKNISVWGHRGTVFRRLGELQVGDTIIASNYYEKRKFKVSAVKLITPNLEDGYIMAPTENHVLTIITCHPQDTFNQRIIITADLVETEPKN